ncbi:MAG: UDP-N-acetylmuramoyl-L-alanyl-D-glutamate--2,6-diaminopimelate ligase [Deltaproteobacteria bacterium]|nr:UDP-N-acetylmuramoyl-L-alanyl-D-glutamate--2,6-diaminopimelate ligase [Deltaproteobacteria bacterium]
MQLKEILKDVAAKASIPDIDITDICCDSRLVQKGSLFFALTGTSEDGGRYTAEAAKGGASAVVADKEGGPEPAGVPLVVVHCAREALAKASHTFFNRPSEKLYLCGVTGTNGKTTLTYLLENIWKKENTCVVGTVNMRYRDHVIKAQLTTPDSITLQNFFGQAAAQNTKYAVMEVSSHALRQKRAHGCQFDSVVFTNLTQDHLDYHKDMEDYFAAKSILFDEVIAESTKKNKLAVVNADDAFGKRLIDRLGRERATGRDGQKKKGGLVLNTFSMSDAKADIFVRNATYSIRDTHATMACGGKNLDFKTNLIGRHNLRNIMAAVLVARHTGLDIHEIIRSFENVHVPGRLERVLKTSFFVDYAHTPDALHNVVTALREIMSQDPQSGRLIVVFGCGGDRDRTKRPLMGKIAAEHGDVVIITSDNPRTEDPEKIIQDIRHGVDSHTHKFDGETGYLVEANRRVALERVVRMAQPRDTVLVAGKGHEDYQILGKEKIHFDDREILRDLLKR